MGKRKPVRRIEHTTQRASRHGLRRDASRPMSHKLDVPWNRRRVFARTFSTASARITSRYSSPLLSLFKGNGGRDTSPSVASTAAWWSSKARNCPGELRTAQTRRIRGSGSSGWCHFSANCSSIMRCCSGVGSTSPTCSINGEAAFDGEAAAASSASLNGQPAWLISQVSWSMSK